MSLAANARNTVLATPYNADKVVRVFTGSYSSGDLITRVGSLATAYVFRIAHGLTRPVICDLITSTDSGTTWDLGIGKIAFSDSTYIYIFHGYATTGTPVTYKVYCTWIDNYDGTNPSVGVITYSANKIAYDSRSNFQKIAQQGEVSFTPGTFGTSQTQTITHSLGYQPNAKVYFEAFSGEVWPLNIGGTRNGFLYDGPQDECEANIYINTLDIKYYKYSNATRRAWYRIYYDAN